MTVPAPAPAPINERALLLTLAGMQFTHIVDFMVMMPLGPQLTRLMAISDAQFGLLVSAYTLAAGASGLLASLYIDRFERKRLLLWLYAGFTLATLACGLAPGYGSLMAARVTAGLFGGVLGALVQTIVGDTVPFERRGHAMGVVMGSFSMATVAGVPLSLFIAAHLGWHASFIAIAVASVGLGLLGLKVLPVIDGHLRARAAAGDAARAAAQAAGHAPPAAPHPLAAMAAVLRERAHWHAFGLTAVVMAASFIVIPFITLYMTINVGVREDQVPLVYLAGGLATFFSSRFIGRMADRFGKVPVFRVMVLLSMAPLLGLTHLGAVPLWAAVAVGTAFFVLVSGRMVPTMALVTAVPPPPLRGTFMSLHGAMQSAAMGLASMAGGLLIGRDAAGRITGYGLCGWVAVGLSLLTLWQVGRLQVRTAPPAPAGARG